MALLDVTTLKKVLKIQVNDSNDLSVQLGRRSSLNLPKEERFTDFKARYWHSFAEFRIKTVLSYTTDT